MLSAYWGRHQGQSVLYLVSPRQGLLQSAFGKGLFCSSASRINPRIYCLCIASLHKSSRSDELFPSSLPFISAVPDMSRHSFQLLRLASE